MCDHPTLLKAKISKKDHEIDLNNGLLPYACLSCGELFLTYSVSLADNPEFQKILTDGVKEWKKNIPRI